jgi:hypothetical protein
MTRTRYRPWAFARLFLVLVALAHGISSALADGADVYSDSSGRFDSTQTLIDSGDYAGAVTELQQLLTKRRMMRIFSICLASATANRGCSTKRSNTMDAPLRSTRSIAVRLSTLGNCIFRPIDRKWRKSSLRD